MYSLHTVPASQPAGPGSETTARIVGSEIVSGLQWYGPMEQPQQGVVNNINNGIEPAVQQVS